MNSHMVSLTAECAAFGAYLQEWLEGLAEVKLGEVVRESGGPDRIAVMCVDVIAGFCESGPLASPRVGAIVPPITTLFTRAVEMGVRWFALPQDAHSPDTPEFKVYPPHCLKGTVEAQTVAALSDLQANEHFVTIEKNSISSAIGTRLDEWLDEHPEVRRFIVVGDCTDLCTYQLAMHLRLRANALNHTETEVIVPADCVQTFDTPFETATTLGIPPHPGDLLHALFLYHMAFNGIRIARALV